MTLLSRKIIEDLSLKNRNFCSSDYDACLEYFKSLLPFHVHEYRCQGHDQGWTIPPKWDLMRGTISFQGRLLFSAESPLQVIGLSAPFQGTLALEELKKHLHYDKRFPHAVPYHFRQNYRPWERDWGFCVTKDFFDSLQEGMHTVEIATREAEGYLRIAELVKPGKIPHAFAFVAHLDHAGMANDDLAGVAVGVEFFQRLFNKPTKFTYRLVLLQEIIGSHFYLKYHRDQNILESCFLEMLGSATPLALQASYAGKSRLEECLASVLEENQIPHRNGRFREIICNDEVMWESVGIPMSSLSRFPYPEYHSDKDNPSIIHDHALEEAISVLEKLVEKLDTSSLVCKGYEGVVGVSHPHFQLYVDPGQPAFNINPSTDQKKLRQLMDLLPLAPKKFFVEQLAREADVSLQDTLKYLEKWQEKALLTII